MGAASASGRTSRHRCDVCHSSHRGIGPRTASRLGSLVLSSLQHTTSIPRQSPVVASTGGHGDGGARGRGRTLVRRRSLEAARRPDRWRDHPGLGCRQGDQGDRGSWPTRRAARRCDVRPRWSSARTGFPLRTCSRCVHDRGRLLAVPAEMATLARLRARNRRMCGPPFCRCSHAARRDRRGRVRVDRGKPCQPGGGH
jgi:hypothetical protein